MQEQKQNKEIINRIEKIESIIKSQQKDLKKITSTIHQLTKMNKYGN